eukprot:gnl/Chilomastix_cuspidata/11800.p1 GENE.gnl/Chilomastix_cuspidata/11800~~gnl/Chilomastix_cuspidata/11800.p1  ORF type:complete len:142 (-),score=24.93 gnl/Chilomastix_cuspidata/11800:30-455(-)
MPKGKKTIIKEIKLLEDNEILINGKEYIILETTEDIETAKTMKVSSNGNRILRFEDESKKARIDLKRSIDIIKITFKDEQRAKKFFKTKDRKLILPVDTKEIVTTVNSFIQARSIVCDYQDKNSKNYDRQIGVNTFYLFEE